VYGATGPYVTVNVAATAMKFEPVNVSETAVFGASLTPVVEASPVASFTAAMAGGVTASSCCVDDASICTPLTTTMNSSVGATVDKRAAGTEHVKRVDGVINVGVEHSVNAASKVAVCVVPAVTAAA